MTDERIPARGPNGGTYPGWGHSSPDMPMPFLPPKPPKSHKGLWIAGIIAAVVVVLCGVSAIVVGSVASSSANVVRANSATSVGTTWPTPEAKPKGQPVGGTFNLPVGRGVTLTTDDGVLQLWVTKVQRVTSCGDYDKPQHAGDVLLVISLKAIVTKGTADVNPFDWSFTDTSGSDVDQWLADCTHKLGLGEWPGENSVRTGKTVIGYLEYETKPNVAGELTFAPALDDAASWKILG